MAGFDDNRPSVAGAGMRRGPAGIELTALGFGAAPIGNLYAAVDDAEASSAVRRAWDLGIRYIDTAPYYGYGLSEQRVGRALADKPRDSFVLSSKVGRCVHEVSEARVSADGFAVSGRGATFDYSRAGVRRSLESSLMRLGTHYIDILFLHDIGAATHGAQHAQILKQALDEALPEMVQLKAEGLCRAIGIGVNERDVCLEVMPRFPLDCIMLAGRYTLLEQAEGIPVLDEALKRAVRVIVAGPYNSGLLGNVNAPGESYNYRPADATIRARAERLYQVCAEAGVEVGAAAIQFPLAHRAVAAVVAGMRSPNEVDSGVVRARATVPASLWRNLRKAGLLLPEAPTP